MVDINRRALSLAKQNAEFYGAKNVHIVCGDGMSAFREQSFDMILSNPPLRAGNRVVFALIAEAPLKLREKGELFLVARTRQGASSIQRQMEWTFGNVEVVSRGGGYRVFRSIRQVTSLSKVMHFSIVP